MKKLVMSFFAIMLFIQPAVAAVITTEKTEGYADYVYVAGETDNYPIEYYDNDKKAYCGIIPDMFAEISERSGKKFAYINGNQTDKNTMGENLQVDIISSVDMGSGVSYGGEVIELLSYESEGRIKRYGIAFTEVADKDTIEKVKGGINEVSFEEKSGIYLSYASGNSKFNYLWIIIAVALLLLLIGFIVVLVARIKRIKKENYVDKMTDFETGMGNLRFFKHHFRNTISDVERSLYYVSYIVLDSSYLRSYHGDSSFEEVLKYTASVLSEETGDREITARITENGFTFAFQATNDDDAMRRLEQVMNKLNGFEDVKGSKLVFHAAVYHLTSADRNCEILLFNLRKNCNKIFGTDKQIICCDTHSMNRIQEEKKITESILKGFEKNEFKMYLQFIVDNKTKKIVSAEALSRWDSPEKGLIGPGQYIGNMESAGLISKHDFYMFELACRQLEKWKDTKYGDVALSCNFTRITLSEENLIDRLSMIANSYSFDKSKLAIEITEDAIEKDREIATKNVMKCKELGFRVYLDDLGSGYTSLANLCDYPIDVVKIDRDILLKTENQKGKDLFSGIVALAHSLNIKVICEGVETPEQNALVSSSDCDFIQGWYYSKALPVTECESFMNIYEKRS